MLYEKLKLNQGSVIKLSDFGFGCIPVCATSFVGNVPGVPVGSECTSTSY